jgi:hypothetical protein
MANVKTTTPQPQKIAYFQFSKSQKYPFFVRVNGEELVANASTTMEKLGFVKSDETQYRKHLVAKTPFKLVNLSEASHQLGQKIGVHLSELDQFGAESVTPGENYEVYRYRGHGLLVFSLTQSVWEMGISVDFSRDAQVRVFKIMLSRAMGLALGTMGVISFWGVPVDEGFVVMKQTEAQSECIFLDLKHRKFLTIEGEKKITAETIIIRLDREMKGESRRISREEAYSFLSTHANYFSYRGINPQLRENIFAVANTLTVQRLPFENFKPRTGLSI